MNLKWQFFTEDAPSKNDVAKILGTSDDNSTKPSDTKTPIVNKSIEDPSNARCQDLIKDFEAQEDQLKQYYKNGHATKVFILINIHVIARYILFVYYISS